MDAGQTIRDHRTFRVIIKAMSHPGKVYRLPEFEGEETAIIEFLGCLLDHETGVAVVGEPTLARNLARHTGCRLVACREADFVIVGRSASSADIPEIKTGSLEYPDKGATILYLVDGLSEDEDGIVLSGPGIDDKISLRIWGLASGEISRLRQLNRHFPLGIDAIFLVPRQNGLIACIPRSAQIGENQWDT